MKLRHSLHSVGNRIRAGRTACAGEIRRQIPRRETKSGRRPNPIAVIIDQKRREYLRPPKSNNQVKRGFSVNAESTPHTSTAQSRPCHQLGRQGKENQRLARY